MQVLEIITIFNKKGLLLPDDIEQIIIYEIDENSRPIRLIGRVKV